MVEISIFRIDPFTFWVGFVAGIIFAWLISLASKGMPRFMQFLRSQIQSVREGLLAGNENRMRQDVLNWAQKQHLASALFSLDEIALQPRLMAFPHIPEDEESLVEHDITSQTIPYMPDWPELAANYGAPTLTLPEALQNGANILVIGQPGSGKSFALAHLASQIARRDPEIGSLGNLYPLLLPVSAMVGRLDSPDPLDVFIQTVTDCYASKITIPRLRNILKMLLQTDRIILILDGLDEINVQSIDAVENFLLQLKRAYPKIRMILSASHSYYGGLSHLGLVPMGMSLWNFQEKITFIQQWQQQWNLYISGDELTNIDFIDSLLLVKWLSNRDVSISPFEVTLKTWGTFAGDITGPNTAEYIEAHVKRMTAEYSNAGPAMEAVALEIVNGANPLILQRDAERAISNYLRNQDSTPVQTEDEATEQTAINTTPTGTASQIVSAMLDNGLLFSLGRSQITFVHPLILGFLAAKGLANQEEHLVNLDDQLEWTGKAAAVGFLSLFSDITPIVEQMLEIGRITPLHHQSFLAARWLQIAPSQVIWRPALMRYLLDIVQRDFETLSLSGRAVTALALTGDPGMPALFRKLLKSNHENIRQLAALGLGMIGDSSAVNDLSSLINDVEPSVMMSACMGLISIGNKEALDSILTLLLNGSEEMRRAAAESLVNHPQEGIEILKEGLSMQDDLLVRRAVIHGFVRTKDMDLFPILEHAAIEDSQWVVRNAAAQAMEIFKAPNPFIPTPMKPLTQQGWLLEYAAKSGLGVADEKQGFDLVIQALEHGEYNEKIKALSYLRLHTSEDSVPRLYNTLYSSNDKIREACYDVLWHIRSSGIDLPSPVKFGLGSVN